MEAFTTIRNMMAGNKIVVPSYQRAYSWDTSFTKAERGNHVNTFMADLDDFIKSNAKSYYFGHFLFRDKSDNEFEIVDGQQRLTTIIIFLSALFEKLKSIRSLTEKEQEYFEDMVKRNSTYRFTTVDYDNPFFKDYIINRNRTDTVGFETVSLQRIVRAFDFFSNHLANKDANYCEKMLETIATATCSTHSVEKESDAVQMFIFQNNRGKKPSDLEVIKAKFMYNTHLYGGDDTEDLLQDIKEKFERIYKAISYIENRIDEDDILSYTLKVYANNLTEWNAVTKVDTMLSESNPIHFIKSFTELLSFNFDYLKRFFNEDDRSTYEVHSLATLGGLSVVMPFILKAYRFGVERDEFRKLCVSLESLVLRHRLIGTRADITTRINGVFKGFTKDNPSIDPIIEIIDSLKNTDDWWWSYWNNKQLEYSVQGWINHGTAKYILWKYENYLRGQGKAGYPLLRFDEIESPELEHISPKTPTDGQPIEAGYSEYDEEFVKQFVDCIGNYLLLSKSHNCSVGNRPFKEKRDSYTHLEQQREIQEMTKDDYIWDKSKIDKRKKILIDFILNNF